MKNSKVNSGLPGAKGGQQPDITRAGRDYPQNVLMVTGSSSSELAKMAGIKEPAGLPLTGK